MTPNDDAPYGFTCAYPVESWARVTADALIAAGWLASVLALDAAVLRSGRPDLAAPLPDDLLVAYLVLAYPPPPLDRTDLWAGCTPTAEDTCARCRSSLDVRTGPVKLGRDWYCRGCLTSAEAECVTGTPREDWTPEGWEGGDA